MKAPMAAAAVEATRIVDKRAADDATLSFLLPSVGTSLPCSERDWISSNTAIFNSNERIASCTIKSSHNGISMYVHIHSVTRLLPRDSLVTGAVFNRSRYSALNAF